MLKDPIKAGLLLFGITMLLFFIVYYFFSGANYWMITISSNAFVLPTVYALMAFLAVNSLRKDEDLNFKKAFRHAFTVLFLGGVLSMGSIFMFLNYVDTGARDILNHQFMQVQENRLEESRIRMEEQAAQVKDESKKEEVQKQYENYKAGIEAARKNKTNYFSFQYISGLFGGILIFYLFLATAVGAFLKNKKKEA